jgi:hypothetical protein
MNNIHITVEIGREHYTSSGATGLRDLCGFIAHVRREIARERGRGTAVRIVVTGEAK